MQYINKLTTPIIFLVSLFLFTYGINHQEVISFDSRFYLFALEMWQNGPTWFPITYHQPYPDYTSASTFLIYLSACLLGGMSKLAAVLPTAIAAALTMVMTYKIAALHDKRWGFAALCFMLLTFTFFKAARGIALDLYPTVITASCFYLVYSADKLSKPARRNWIYPLIFLSFVFRGPIGLVMPVGVVCVYYLLQKKYQTFFKVGFISLFILVLCSISLLMLAYHVGGSDFMRDVLRMQVVGRMGENKLPFYFYFTNGMANYALAFPVAVMVLLGLWFSQDKKWMPAFAGMTVLAGWMLVILIGMSIPGEKKTRYILPFVPAIALIASYPFLEYVSVKNMKLLALTVIVFVLTMFTVVEPLELYRDRAHDFVVALEAKRKQAKADLVFYKINHDGLPIKYVINMPQQAIPIFIDNSKELAGYKAPAFVITRQEEYEVLPVDVKSRYRIIAKDNVGHVGIVVFTQPQSFQNHLS